MTDSDQKNSTSSFSSIESFQRSLTPEIYNDIKKIAKYHLGVVKGSNTLSPTVLVNEAWIKLQGSGSSADVSTKRHFYNLVSRVIRQIIVDYIRQINTFKRLHEKVELNEGAEDSAIFNDGSLPIDEMLEVEKSISDLEKKDPMAASVLCLKIYVGLTSNEISDVLEVSKRTVERLWDKSKNQITNN
ncbi:MAG: hypothetical protein HWE24_02200 [Oceanospirillaceae bacterium]|nr:hypothetical protein [Oceanospirillaceae bacterium]